MRWYQAQCQGRQRKPCEGHTVNVVDRCLIILFGKHEDDVGNVICPVMQVLDTDTWTLKPAQVDNAPSEREGHTASVIGNKIIVFGGTWTDDDESTTYMNDLHILDIPTGCANQPSAMTWAQPATSRDPPIEREGHSASVIGRKLYIFAGTWVDEDDNSVYLNDLYVLDTDNFVWTNAPTSGMQPSEREGHTACVSGRQIVIFGGAGLDKHDRSVNLYDVHILDTGNMMWSQPNVTGKIPQERRYHTASIMDKRMYVFGGQYYDPNADLHFECENMLMELNLETNVWRECGVEGIPPLRRACHSAAVVGSQIILVGGRYWDVAEDDYIFMNDIQILDTNPSSTLSLDWAAYYQSEDLSDATIEIEGRTIPVHKVVLSARCAHFQRMFGSGMQESSGDVIRIEDVRELVFEKLLQYLYTDEVEVPGDLALELFSAADRFGVERLKCMCATKIESELDEKSACHVLTIADQHSAFELKQYCVNFIVSHFPDVIQTESWKHLSRPLLDLIHLAISCRLFPDYDRGKDLDMDSTCVNFEGSEIESNHFASKPESPTS